MSDAENSRPDGNEAPWPPIRTDQDNRLEDIRRIVREELAGLGVVLEAFGGSMRELAQAQRESAGNLAELCRVLADEGEEEPEHDLEGRELPPERDQTKSLDRPPPKSY